MEVVTEFGGQSPHTGPLSTLRAATDPNVGGVDTWSPARGPATPARSTVCGQA